MLIKNLQGMDVLKTLPNSENAVLAITKSTNEHILAFYCNDTSEPCIEPKWVLREHGTITSIQDLTFFQKIALNVQLHDEDSKSIVTFGLPITDERKLYLMRTPSSSETSSRFGIFFEDPINGGMSKMEEMYVDLFKQCTLAQCYIKCKTKDNADHMEQLQVDLGPISTFFIK